MVLMDPQNYDQLDAPILAVLLQNGETLGVRATEMDLIYAWI
jgi:hypothetical protein